MKISSKSKSNARKYSFGAFFVHVLLVALVWRFAMFPFPGNDVLSIGSIGVYDTSDDGDSQESSHLPNDIATTKPMSAAPIEGVTEERKEKPKEQNAKRPVSIKENPTGKWENLELNGCQVCESPEKFSLDQLADSSTSLVCQSFWHKKYDSWEACRTAALDLRTKFREQLCHRCEALKSHKNIKVSGDPQKMGVVYGISGESRVQYYLSQARRGIATLRSDKIGYTGPIQVFTESKNCQVTCEKTMNGLNADCRLMQRKINVGFNAKLVAVLESDLDAVIVIDTDNMLLRDPSEVFEFLRKRPEHVILWPDLWGEACRHFQWNKADDNPTGVMLAGQTAWPDHVVWPTIDVKWQPFRHFSQENLNSITVVDRRYRGALEAYELAVWMSEQEFFGKVMYGEKDCVRVALLAVAVPFYLVEDAPWELVDEKSARHHLMAILDGSPLTLDFVKNSKPCCNMQADFIASAVGDVNNEVGSFCIHKDYGRASPHDETIQIEDSSQNPLARYYLDLVNSM